MARPPDVIILDRDGTLVVDRGYLADPEGLSFLPDVGDALKWLHQCGYRLVVVTNQSGVGRGLISMSAMEAMNVRLHAMVETAGAKLEKIYWCPHVPEDGCDCRKPALGLMQRAERELDFLARNAVVIGDKRSDVEFGLRAGARSILISSQMPRVQSGSVAYETVPTLLDAARAIVLAQQR